MSPTGKTWLPSRRTVLWFAAVIVFLLFAAPPVISSLLNVQRIKQALVAQMEASFGRPVEVSEFSVSLLGGLRVEANYVTVAEDPRFGHEFFLRAEQITASLRWQALFRGRLEFGNLALLRPSVNLVRNGEGQWNLLAWLPPAGARAATPGRSVSLPRLYRITVDGGRINFKFGEDKKPFALQSVAGSFSHTSAGNWQVDFLAEAFRAGAIIQEPGELRVRGTIGGPESRIVPADVFLTWNEASIADVLRLLRGRDFGVRGNLAAELHVKTDGERTASEASWSFAGSARMDGLHGWQLPPRSTDPAISLQWDATWLPAQATIVLRKASLESAASSVQIEGNLGWKAGANSSALHVRSTGLALADAFAFYRAFHSEVSQQANLQGLALLDAEFSGWPLRITSFHLRAAEGSFQLSPSERALTFYNATVQYNPRREQFEFLPLTLAMHLDVPASARRLVVTPMEFRWEGILRPKENWTGNWTLSGQASSAKTVQSFGRALGLYSVNAWQSAGWALDGAFAAQLQWRTSLFPFRAHPAGYWEARRAQLSTPLLPGPVDCARVRADFGDVPRFSFSEASALGGVWSGTVLPAARNVWSVSATTPRLDAGPFDQVMTAGVGAAENRLAAIMVGTAASGGARLRAEVSLSPELTAPFLQPLRPENLTLQGSLELPSRRSVTLTGPWGAVTVASPASAQR